MNPNKYPEEYKGMKVKLLVKYLNWFEKNVPRERFDFNFYLTTFDHAVRHRNEMQSGIGHDCVIRRLQRPVSKGAKRITECGSVGCFTGWSGYYKPINTIVNEHRRLLDLSKVSKSHYINYSLFGRVIGINITITMLLLSPTEGCYSVADNDIDKIIHHLGRVTHAATKRDIINRVKKFIELVMNDTIDPNPTIHNPASKLRSAAPVSASESVN